jgi:hypothetical protein
MTDLHERGVQESMEHRGCDQQGERTAVGCCIPSVHATIGPLREMMANGEEALYMT